jgi:hypothetical protein
LSLTFSSPYHRAFGTERNKKAVARGEVLREGTAATWESKAQEGLNIFTNAFGKLFFAESQEMFDEAVLEWLSCQPFFLEAADLPGCPECVQSIFRNICPDHMHGCFAIIGCHIEDNHSAKLGATEEKLLQAIDFWQEKIGGRFFTVRAGLRPKLKKKLLRLKVNAAPHFLCRHTASPGKISRLLVQDGLFYSAFGAPLRKFRGTRQVAQAMPSSLARP